MFGWMYAVAAPVIAVALLCVGTYAMIRISPADPGPIDDD